MSMKRKIKLYIQTPDRTINLPKLSLKHAGSLFKLGLKFGQRYLDNNTELNALVKSNQNEIINLIDFMIDEVNDLEPFVLVDIRSSNERIRIEIL